MKTKNIALGLLSAGLLLSQGCLSFPPLVQVEHKHEAENPAPSNAEIMRRLDSIDQRLNQIEKTTTEHK
jgi:hypothetical protein